jgi:hypothetical protein
MILTFLIFIGGVFAIGSSAVRFVAFLLQIEHSQVSSLLSIRAFSVQFLPFGSETFSAPVCHLWYVETIF